MASIAVPLVGSSAQVDASVLTIMAATLFNMAPCLLFTLGLPVGSAMAVAACEVAISTLALALARNAISDKALLVMLVLVGYLLALPFVRQGTSPKIARDLMISFV